MFLCVYLCICFDENHLTIHKVEREKKTQLCSLIVGSPLSNRMSLIIISQSQNVNLSFANKNKWQINRIDFSQPGGFISCEASIICMFHSLMKEC